MSATIHYDFEACNKCVEQLFLLHDRWQTNRPKLPEMDGQGTFMNELREITEVLDTLHAIQAYAGEFDERNYYAVIKLRQAFENVWEAEGKGSLNYALDNYPNNQGEADLLKFTLEGYDEPVYAGAMVEGYADIGNNRVQLSVCEFIMTDNPDDVGSAIHTESGAF